MPEPKRKRKKTDPGKEDEVLRRCGRRCCLCWALNQDLGVKQGQLAHLDRDPSNDELDDLVFLCLDHHEQYDCRTSQSKGLTEEEVRHYRDDLVNQRPWEMQGEAHLEIKDSTFRTKVEGAEEAVGMEVDKPAVLDNVEVTLEATNVRKAVGFSTNQSLTGSLRICIKCGQPIPYAHTGQPSRANVRCPHCGTENPLH